MFLVLFLSIVYFISPRDILGWGKFNTRFLPFIFVFMLLAAEPFSKRIFNRAFLGWIVTLSLVIITIISSYVVKLNKDLDDYLSGVPLMKKNPIILPLRLETYKIGKIRPLHWAFDYYNVFKGGATGRSVVTYIGRVPMKYKRPIEETFPHFDPKSPQDADMTRIRECYDYILCWGEKSTDLHNIFEQNGFKLMHEQGRLTLYEKTIE